MLKKNILAEPVLVGREREIEQLQHFFKLAATGKGTTVFISGEAGSGKTRLIKEFLKVAQKKDVTVLTGWCLSGAAIPYFPFVEAFGSSSVTINQKLGLQSWLLETGLSLAEAKNANIQPEAWKDQTFYKVNQELLLLSAKKPLILTVEDIHWADSASLSLIHYLARQVVSERILILATYRKEELNIDVEGQLNPLSNVLLLLGRDDLFREVKLPNLRVDDIRRIAKNMLGGNVQLELVEKLAADSNGNPLFVVESIRMLYQQGRLSKKKDQWSLSVQDFDVPRKVRDVILRRVETLKPDQRKILDVASVVGEKFNPELVAEAVSRDNSDVLITLNEIAKRTLILHTEDNNYKFEHAKFREMLYQDVPPILRREYHRRIAEALEVARQSGIEVSVSDLAHHFVLADNKAKTVKYSLQAGKVALAQFSNVEAIRHLSTVVNISRNNRDLTREKSNALEGLGDAYAANCMYAEAIKTFDQLATSVSGAVRLRAIRKAMDAAFLKGDKSNLLLEYAKEAEELSVYDRLEMARVLENRGRAFGWAGRGDLRMDLSDYETALRMFEEENSLPDVAEALGRHGEASVAAEDLREKALGELLRSITIFKELGDARKEVEATLRAGFAFSFGLFPEARRLLVTVLDAGEKLGMFVELARAHGILGLLDEREGRFEEALSQVFKALEYYKMTDVIYVQCLDLAALTRIYCKLGDLEHADEYFNKMTKLPPEVLKTGLTSSMILVSKGVYFAAKGRWRESNQFFEKLAKTGWRTHEDYAWALEQEGRFEEAKAQRTKAKIFHRQIEKQFEHTNLQLSVMMPRKVKLGDEFEVRLDIVNVARNPGKLVKVEGLLPSGSKVVSLPTFCSVRDSSIEMKKKSIGAFQAETIKVGQAILKENAFTFNPCLFYLDDLGEKKACKAQPFTVRAELASSKDKLESVAKHMRFEFESEAAEKAFNFLVSAFKEDYTKCKLPKEKSGWRSLMEIVKNGGVTMNSMYGRSGRGGKAALELERLGLVESRFFGGERGHGGNVFKLRIRLKRSP